MFSNLLNRPRNIHYGMIVFIALPWERVDRNKINIIKCIFIVFFVQYIKNSYVFIRLFCFKIFSKHKTRHGKHCKAVFARGLKCRMYFLLTRTNLLCITTKPSYKQFEWTKTKTRKHYKEMKYIQTLFSKTGRDVLRKIKQQKNRPQFGLQWQDGYSRIQLEI